MAAVNHLGVVGRHERRARRVHEDREASAVRVADGLAALERDILVLGVGALAEADARALAREPLDVALGTAEHRLHHGGDGRVLSAQLADRLEGHVGERRVLHVDGHGRPGVPRRAEHAVRPASRCYPVRVEAERGELDRHVRAASEVLRGERLEQRDVGGDGRVGPRVVGHLLAEVVDRREQALAGQAMHALKGVCGRLARDEPVDDAPRGGHGLDQMAHPRRP